VFFVRKRAFLARYYGKSEATLYSGICLAHHPSISQGRIPHKGWVQGCLVDGEKARDEKWSESIAVGSRPFAGKVKALLGPRAKGRKIKGTGAGYEVRESPARYTGLFGGKKRRYRSRKCLPMER